MDATELAYAGIAKQAELIASGEISSRELVDVYLERIKRLNPKLNAFRVVFEERARMEADQADARRGAGGESSQRPLLGVPIAVKEEQDVAGELTTHGTNAYGEPAKADSEIVRRMRAAGAIVIGKTQMPELGAFPWTESATWGVTRNPWELQHSPGGSSGGSAAAVAAGLVGAALAGDGGGSIRIPSAFSGLFGLKTQRGRVPLAPHAGHWHGLVVYGVLTRSVRDSALFYDAIADGPADSDTPVPPPSSFLGALGQAGTPAPGGERISRKPTSEGSSNGGSATRPLRIAVSSALPPSPLTKLHGENREALEETAALLRSLGHEVHEHEVDHGQLAPALEFTVVYLYSLHEAVGALAYPERAERRIRTLARIGGMLPRGALDWALGRKEQYAARLNESLADHDVLLTPVTPAPAPRIGAREGRSWLRTSVEASATVPHVACWNFTGQPACSVPAGFAADGLPRAVQLVGRPNDEATLVALAAQIEAERPWAQDRPPGFS
jgi:amidase